MSPGMLATNSQSAGPSAAAGRKMAPGSAQASSKIRLRVRSMLGEVWPVTLIDLEGALRVEKRGSNLDRM